MGVQTVDPDGPDLRRRLDVLAVPLEEDRFRTAAAPRHRAVPAEEPAAEREPSDGDRQRHDECYRAAARPHWAVRAQVVEGVVHIELEVVDRGAQPAANVE